MKNKFSNFSGDDIATVTKQKEEISNIEKEIEDLHSYIDENSSNLGNPDADYNKIMNDILKKTDEQINEINILDKRIKLFQSAQQDYQQSLKLQFNTSISKLNQTQQKINNLSNLLNNNSLTLAELSKSLKESSSLLSELEQAIQQIKNENKESRKLFEKNKIELNLPDNNIISIENVEQKIHIQENTLSKLGKLTNFYVKADELILHLNEMQETVKLLKPLDDSFTIDMLSKIDIQQIQEKIKILDDFVKENKAELNLSVSDNTLINDINQKINEQKNFLLKLKAQTDLNELNSELNTTQQQIFELSNLSNNDLFPVIILEKDIEQIQTKIKKLDSFIKENKTELILSDSDNTLINDINQKINAQIKIIPILELKAEFYANNNSISIDNIDKKINQQIKTFRETNEQIYVMPNLKKQAEFYGEINDLISELNNTQQQIIELSKSSNDNFFPTMILESHIEQIQAKRKTLDDFIRKNKAELNLSDNDDVIISSLDQNINRQIKTLSLLELKTEFHANHNSISIDDINKKIKNQVETFQASNNSTQSPSQQLTREALTKRLNQLLSTPPESTSTPDLAHHSPPILPGLEQSMSELKRGKQPASPEELKSSPSKKNRKNP